MITLRIPDSDHPEILQSQRVRRNAPLKEIFIFFLFLFFIISFPHKLKAQNGKDNYEEISVFLVVQGIGGFDISAIYKDDQIFIPVSEIFQCLKINQKKSIDNDSISGFFLSESNKYYISYPGNSIFINNKLNQVTENELIKTESSGLALKIDQFGKLFGLDCKFDFSNLMIELKTSHELPVIRELRLEQIRRNISRLRGEIKVDTTFERKYHVFKGGMADWAVYSTQVNNGKTETRALLGLGGELLGGETNIEINYSSRSNFEKRQQQYSWRWANNNSKIVKQISVGKIHSNSVASIYSPLIGTVITNTPTTYRRSFGTYAMTDFTEPGWSVELYINNVIVDFTTADASGFFKFDIPLVYGASNITVKFYGPWGEERLKEQRISVPFNFLPVGELQYSIAGAMVQDTSHSIFSRSEFNYGISRHLTIGGGYEYLSSIKSAPSIPFVSASAQLFNNLLLNGEYAHGVRSKTNISYNFPNNFVIDIDYTKYVHEQKAITFNYLEERRIRVSLPILLNKIKAYSRLSYSQNVLKETSYSTAEAIISTFYKNVSANFTANANWLGKYDPYIYGNLALGYRFSRTLSIRPQIQYDFSNKNLIYTKLEIENNFSRKCNLSLIWENNIRSQFNSIELTFRYDLSFSQVSFNTRISKNYIMTGENARGSIALGSGNNKVIPTSRTQVGRAGLTIVPFLDINNNNHRDKNEPITPGLNIRINGGSILPNSKDSIIRIMDLEPFASYMLEFSDTQFDNIAWQLQNKTISVLMDPNQFKLLEIPIKIMGEINGIIYIKTGSNLKAQGRIQINIFNTAGKQVAKTQSESDGYFNYIGLAPGKYYAEIDSMQLSRLNAVSTPVRFDFEILASENGDIIDNIEFTILKQGLEIQSNTIPEIKKKNVTEKNEMGEIKKQQTTIAEKNAKSEPILIPSPVFKNDKPKSIEPEKVKTEPDSQIKPQKKLVKEEVSNVGSPTNQIVQENTRPTLAPNSENTLSTLKKFYIQAGAFKSKDNADKLSNLLYSNTQKRWFIIYDAGLHKVRLGYFTTREAALEAEKSLTIPGIPHFIGKTQ